MAAQNAFEYQCPPLPLGLFDLGGVLYHANYFQLFEQAREAFLAAHGIPYPKLAAENQHLAIAESHQQFVKPVRYGDAVSIALSAVELRNSSVTLAYALHLDTQGPPAKAAHQATTKLVYVDANSGAMHPARLPDNLRQAFSEILQTTLPAQE